MGASTRKPRPAANVTRMNAFAMERPDWTLFRTIEGLQQKAGVPARLLRRLVVKELADNALDEGAHVSVSEVGGTYVIEDDGRGIEGGPEAIARLFSIGRPLLSTKLLRLPTRGALGNGLRVVAGAVLASHGSLVVVTKSQRIALEPLTDGSTRVAAVEAADMPRGGTRVEVSLGAAIPADRHALAWAWHAIALARGQSYAGKSSPFWYDAPHFRELLLAAGSTPFADLVARLDVPSKSDHDPIWPPGVKPLSPCEKVATRAEAVLIALRNHAKPVPPSRLGWVGGDTFDGFCYARSADIVAFGEYPRAMIPFVVEAWARKSDGDTTLTILINRTPATADAHAARDKRDIDAFGCGLAHTLATARPTDNFDIWLNVVAPYVPITSDGKEPNLRVFLDPIQSAVQRAVTKARPRVDEVSALLPKRRRGRQSAEEVEQHRLDRQRFCRLIAEISEGMDFKVGSRGWCYILEQHGLTKGDFDRAETLIADCRKSGELPLDICAEDASRETKGIENIDDDSVEVRADALVATLRDRAHLSYTPVSFWDDQSVYVEAAVEKLDLRNLFAAVAEDFFVPITNFKGWSDINARAAMMRRFKTAEEQGKTSILLVCGDHDPGGLRITDTLRKNLEDLAGAVGWTPTPDNLKIVRFGLNADFIAEAGLTWIDNLETSSGKRLDDPTHPDHKQDYVQDYIRRFGVRKCEANALVVAPDLGRDLFRRAILEHVAEDAPARHRERLDAQRERLHQAILRRLGG
jgi:hypothetical protein